MYKFFRSKQRNEFSIRSADFEQAVEGAECMCVFPSIPDHIIQRRSLCDSCRSLLPAAIALRMWAVGKLHRVSTLNETKGSDNV